MISDQEALHDAYLAGREVLLAALEAAEAKLAAVESLFAGGPDTVCRTTWREHGLPDRYGIPRQECVEVPMEALRAAFGDPPAQFGEESGGDAALGDHPEPAERQVLAQLGDDLALGDHPEPQTGQR